MPVLILRVAGRGCIWAKAGPPPDEPPSQDPRSVGSLPCSRVPRQSSEGVVGTFPHYQKAFHVFSDLGLDPRTQEPEPIHTASCSTMGAGVTTCAPTLQLHSLLDSSVFPLFHLDVFTADKQHVNAAPLKRQCMSSRSAWLQTRPKVKPALLDHIWFHEHQNKHRSWRTSLHQPAAHSLSPVHPLKVLGLNPQCWPVTEPVEGVPSLWDPAPPPPGKSRNGEEAFIEMFDKDVTHLLLYW